MSDEQRRPVRLWKRPIISGGVLLVVFAVALFIGSGVLSSKPETNAQRTLAIAGKIRCPNCVDLSVAQSTTPDSLAVRREIGTMVDEGRSTQQIESVLVSRFGPTILLTPPSGGLTDVVWILPLVVGLAAFGVTGTLFWRRSRSFRRLRGAVA